MSSILNRKQRVRAKISGDSKRPRLSVYVSNQRVSAQLIDDTAGKTITSVTSSKADLKNSLTEQAKAVGKAIAESAKKHKIKTVVFDRNGKIYHGRVKAVADAAREAGLEF